MAEASLLVADTGTMVNEAALLGTPALRYRGTDDHEYGEFRELERVGLAEQFDEYEAIRDRSLELVADETASDRWATRRREYVGDLVNLTDLLVDVAQAGGSLERVTPSTRRALQSTSPVGDERAVVVVRLTATEFDDFDGPSPRLLPVTRIEFIATVTGVADRVRLERDRAPSSAPTAER